MLGRQHPELDWRLGVFALHAPAGGIDHPRRGIAGQNGNILSRQKERIFPRAAIELQDFRARFEGIDQSVPDNATLCTANHGPGEQVIVRRRQAVEREYGLAFHRNTHASTSATVESSPARACSMLWRRLAALSELAAAVPAIRASCTSSFSS